MINFSIPVILIGFGMCGLLLHYITVSAVKKEKQKNPSVPLYIWFSLATLWFTPLYLSIKLAILLGNGEMGILLWIAVSVIGFLYMMAITAAERKKLQDSYEEHGNLI